MMLFTLVCSSLRTAVDCIGCRPTQPIFPTNAMKLERFYYYSNIYKINEYLTPMRLYDLCLVDMEGNSKAVVTTAIRLRIEVESLCSCNHRLTVIVI